MATRYRSIQVDFGHRTSRSWVRSPGRAFFLGIEPRGSKSRLDRTRWVGRKRESSLTSCSDRIITFFQKFLMHVVIQGSCAGTGYQVHKLFSSNSSAHNSNFLLVHKLFLLTPQHLILTTQTLSSKSSAHNSNYTTSMSQLLGT